MFKIWHLGSEIVRLLTQLREKSILRSTWLTTILKVREQRGMFHGCGEPQVQKTCADSLPTFTSVGQQGSEIRRECLLCRYTCGRLVGNRVQETSSRWLEARRKSGCSKNANANRIRLWKTCMLVRPHYSGNAPALWEYVAGL